MKTKKNIYTIICLATLFLCSCVGKNEDDFGARYFYYFVNETRFSVSISASWKVAFDTSNPLHSQLYNISSGDTIACVKDQYNDFGPFNIPRSNYEEDSVSVIIRFNSEPARCIRYEGSVSDSSRDIRVITSHRIVDKEYYYYHISDIDYSNSKECK